MGQAAGKGHSGQVRETDALHNQPHPDPGVELLIRAGIVLATSLHDRETTMREVAGLTVPGLGDICVVDLLDSREEIRDVAVAAADSELEAGLERLRSSFPINLNGEHPVALVIRSGQPLLLEQLDSDALRSFSESESHADFMIRNAYRSAVVAPLVARDRTLGDISVLRFGEREPFQREDLDLVQALAWRAALAIDNARLFSDLRVLEERMEAVLVNLAEAMTVEDSDGRLVFANPAAADLLGAKSPEELTSAPKGTFRPRFRWLDEQGTVVSWAMTPGRRLFAGEHPEPVVVRTVERATGEERWLVLRSSGVRDPERDDELIYAVNVFENVTDIKRAQLAGAFLAEASRVLASSMDYNLTLKRLTRLTVPQVADWCAVDLLTERGEIERVAIHHPDAAKLKLAHRLALEYPYDPADERGVAGVIKNGVAAFASHLDPEALAGYARDAIHLQLLQEIGMGSAIVVPMEAAGHVIGAITLVAAESKRRFTKEDLELAEELGRRAGVAVENARLYTERTRIALTLQQALLPESLPSIPGVELDALYTAAGELNEVGGDFYDVFDYGEDRWMLVIGDVCGKGPHAAAVTALARYTLRAAAMSGQSPREMLTMLDRALRRGSEPSELCTVCLVALDREPQGGRATVALAGHPPPLLIAEDGKIEQVGRIGTLLGAISPLKIEETEVTLGEHDTLLLYTDGVIDAGSGGSQLGEEGLLDVCASAREERVLSGLLRCVEQAALEQSDGRLRDDLALLGVRLTPALKPAAEPAATTAP
ncbi:MAG: SpoIIE family protein phosphatase [Solirubrobacteraceae bacterium]